LLIIFIGFFYEFLFFYYLEQMRRELERIEEEEILEMLKKKYEK